MSSGSSTVVHVAGRSARWRVIRARRSASPARAVATNAVRQAAARARSTACRLFPLRAPPRSRCAWWSRGRPQVFPRRPVRGTGVRAGLLAFGSSYSPRLPSTRVPVAVVGFVPDYSDGVAADSHRLPWGPRTARAARMPRARPTLSRRSGAVKATAGRPITARAAISPRGARSAVARAWWAGRRREDDTPSARGGPRAEAVAA